MFLLNYIQFFFQSLGKRLIFIKDVFFSLKPFYGSCFIEQFIKIFFFSLMLISMTSFFTGAVLVLQSYAGFSRFNAEHAIASIVVISITRELGPVITALMIAGRVGSAITAEISTMKVTDQVDALHLLSVNPNAYLFLPRIISTTLAMPLLVIVANIIGVFGGYIVAIKVLKFNTYSYLQNTIAYLQFYDVMSGLIKAFFFGLTISIIACFNGLHCSLGSKGVGLATTKTLVESSIMILIINYFITMIGFFY